MAGKSVKILGLSFFYHDAAAALIIDGKVVAAAQEERFTRIKHDPAFPKRAADFCLKFGGFKIDDLDYIVFYEKPLNKFERLLMTYIKVWPHGLVSFLKATEAWFKDKLWVEHKIRKELSFRGKILYTEHHYAHAASAYYCSDFDESVVVTMDGVGEWDTTTVGFGRGNQLKLFKSIHFPDSLGLFYSALTYYLGFKVNSAEYKVMGLAPYGNPEVYAESFRKLIQVREDGSFKLNMKYFAYEYGLTMTNKKFDKLFGGPPRKPEAVIEKRHQDIAAALQRITEEIVLKIARHAKTLYPSKNLCLAGGVALNCVANGRILEQGIFQNIYIQPAAGDAGGSIGAALYVYYDVLGHSRQNQVMPTAFWGPEYFDSKIKSFLDHKKAAYEFLSDNDLIERVASLLNKNQVIGWFQGRMEFGPRALGSRSILADPRHKENWQRVNLKIKFRESFRPFAPAVLFEAAGKYFKLNASSPYMLLVAQVKRGNEIPAVTHVDNSARIQTVSKADNKRFYELLKAFENISGCPVLINTSFNVRGEPIVESPEDAFNCFINTEMDYLALGNYLIAKKDNLHFLDMGRREKYLESFRLTG
ncbi:MAG TPA: carbamoyltransferase [Candidatus Paceibacterota bacterium]